MDKTQVINLVREAIKNLVGLDQLAQELHIDELYRTAKLRKSTLWNILKEETRKQKDEADQGGIPIIDVSPERPTDEIFGEVRDFLLGQERYYRYASHLAYTGGDRLRLLPKPEDIQGSLVSRCRFRSKTEKGVTFELFPKDFSLAFPRSCFAEELPVINLFAKLPILNSQFEQMAPGYHRENAIYVACDNVTPSDSIDFLTDLIDDFCFKGRSDRTNYVAFLLTPFVHHLFPAVVPIMLMKGNQPGVGKGEACSILAALRDSDNLRSITFISNDEELEKRVCSVLLTGATTVWLDNVKTSPQMPIIESALIERMVTDKCPSFRILGKNLDLHFPVNVIQTTITYNGGPMSQDLIARQAPVQLEYAGDPAEREFRHANILAYAKENRIRLQAELLGMFERWRRAGMPKAPVKHRMQRWAETIGGVLMANGFEGFLENMGDVRRKSDQDLQPVTELVNIMQTGKGYQTSEIMNLVNGRGLWAREFNDFTDHGRVVALGKTLQRYINRTFTKGETVVILTAVTRHKTTFYRLDPGGDSIPPKKVLEINGLKEKGDWGSLKSNLHTREKNEESSALEVPSAISNPPKLP